MKYTMKVYVGENFKISFWTRIYRICKLDSGYFYFRNKKLISKLKLDKNKVEEVYSRKIEEIEKRNRKLEKEISSINEKFYERANGIDSKIKRILSINKEFLHTLNDFESEKDQDKQDGVYRKKLDERKIEEKLEKFYNVIENLKVDNERLGDKFDGLLDVISDKMANDEPFPNILSSNFSMSRILKLESDNLTKALYSIVYIMKKALSEKGMSIR